MITSVFVREQKRYTQRELQKLFDCDEMKIITILRKLKEFGVLKTVPVSSQQRDLSELQEEDLEITDVQIGGEFYYIFTFVGVIVVSGMVLKCYPKYLQQSEHPQKELRQILRVLKKYNSSKQIIHLFNESGDGGSFNHLAILMYLINDYYENGLYNNALEITEENGSGEILWDKTINETFMFLYKNRPYYPSLQTRKKMMDDFDFFRRLHGYILTEASNELQKAGLLDLFEITEIDLSSETLEDFGEKDYILNKLENELKVEFNTRKQTLLKALYTYIDCGEALYNDDSISLYGTTTFNLVWEKVCSDIVNNQRYSTLNTLELPCELKDDYSGEETLLSLIEKPFWSATGTVAADSLIPDIISIKGGANPRFIIFDAKYYNARLLSNSAPQNQPGIESIVKQYMYQIALQQFASNHGFKSIINCFLLPTEADHYIDKGFVRLSFMHQLNIADIQVRLIPAKKAYDYYLSGNTIELDELI